MAELFANNGDPDQTPHSAVSDLGLHCLLITLLQVSLLQWVNLQELYPTILSVIASRHTAHPLMQQSFTNGVPYSLHCENYPLCEKNFVLG